MRVASLLLVLSLLSCGHVVKLNQAASAVRVSKDAPSGCEDLGEVSGKSNADDQEEAMAGARNDLKNKAHAMGGNYVLLETNNSAPVRGTMKQGIEILLTGRVLRCH
jgi:hypothetical protein